MKKWLSLRPIMGAAALVAVLLIVSLQASLVNQENLSRSASAKGPKDVQISNVGNDAVQAIGGLTAVTTLTDQYYSPNVGLTFTYDPSQMSLVEQEPGVAATMQEGSWVGTIQLIKESNWSQARKKYIQSNSAYWPQAKVVDDQTVSGTHVVTVQTQSPGLVTSTELVERFSVLARQIGSQHLFIALRQKVQSDVAPSPVQSTYEKVLRSAVAGNQLPSGERRVGLSNNIVSVTYNPQVWTTLASQGYRTQFRFNIPSKGSSDTSLAIETQELSNPRAPAQLQGDLDTILHQDEKALAKNSFKIINIPKKTMIDKQEFYFVRYQYVNAFRQKVVVTEYQGYYAPKRLLVQIHSEEDQADVAASREVERMLESITFDSKANVLGASAVAEIPKATILGKPSVVHLFNRSCVNLTLPKSASLPNSSGATYQLCSAGLGTGFFVNKNGYVVTNAHVSAPNSIDVAVNGLAQGYDPSELRTKLAVDSVLILQRQYPQIDFYSAAEDQRVRQMIQNAMITLVVYGIQEKDFKVSEPQYTSYVQSGKPFEVNSRDLSLRNTGDHIATTMVSKRSIDSFYGITISLLQKKKAGITTPDLALLQVKDPKGEYPAIGLAGQEEVSAGQSVFVIGFPGAAENATLFGTQSQTIPTVTKGTVSAIKSNFSESFKLVQIDASIAPGNSGGPIINLDGNVLGVATYGISSDTSGDFNAGVAVEEVARLMNEAKVVNEPGSVTTLVLKGLDNFANKYYRWAVTQFRQAAQQSPVLQDELTPLIAEGEKRIKNGEDNTPVLTLGKYFIHQKEMWIIGGLCCVLGIIGLIALVMFFVGMRKRAKKAKTVDLPSNTPPPASPTPHDVVSAPEPTNNPEPITTPEPVSAQSPGDTLREPASTPHRLHRLEE